MDLLINDLSLHAQFSDIASFQVSLERVMKMRGVAGRHGRALYCHRGFADGKVTAHVQLRAAVRNMPRDQQRAIMGWLGQRGPFWDDDRQHAGSDWYECGGRVVTDTAVAEAAHCLRHGISRGLVSLEPSDFTYDPIEVFHQFDDETSQRVVVPNHWDPAKLETFLAGAPPVMTSWAVLADHARCRFTMLNFSEDAFDALRGQPFKQSVAERVLARLDVLHQLRQCVHSDGSRNAEGHRIYNQHFTGEKAWFSDSSETEKHEFKNELTFRHPDKPETTLFCAWHGKVKSPQYRIHFSWPVATTTPLYVVYVGPKITRKP